MATRAAALRSAGIGVRAQITTRPPADDSLGLFSHK